MAEAPGINTQDKRRSTLRILPVADGSINQGDRWHIWVYRGLFATTPPAPVYLDIALRVKLYLNGVEIETVDFYQQEVRGVIVKPFQPQQYGRLQGGTPELNIWGDAWNIIGADMRYQGQSTREKLLLLKEAARLHYTFRVYPAMIDEPATYYDCLLPGDVPLDYIFAGQYADGNGDQLVFYEASA